MNFQLTPYSNTNTSPSEIEKLLHKVYVDGGFTEPKTAAKIFDSKAVLGRGETLVARTEGGKQLAGMVIVVEDSSSASKLAAAGEVELHLLAVSPEFRGQGVGKSLVESAIELARKAGKTKMLLWTQPSMQAARAIYTAMGFVRHQSKDFKARARKFLVFEYSLQ